MFPDTWLLAFLRCVSEKIGHSLGVIDSDSSDYIHFNSDLIRSDSDRLGHIEKIEPFSLKLKKKPFKNDQNRTNFENSFF